MAWEASLGTLGAEASFDRGDWARTAFVYGWARWLHLWEFRVVVTYSSSPFVGARAVSVPQPHWQGRFPASSSKRKDVVKKKKKKGGRKDVVNQWLEFVLQHQPEHSTMAVL